MAARKNLSPETIAAIRDARMAGDKTEAIAGHFGVTQGAVSYHTRTLGLRGKIRHRMDEIATLREQGCGATRVARHLSCTPSAVLAAERGARAALAQTGEGGNETQPMADQAGAHR